LDPRDFLLKYEVAVEATGRGNACKVKALVLSLRGPAQHWYSNLPNGHIRAWDQLRAELSTVFWAAKPDKVNSCDFHNLEQGGSTLQEYLHCLVRLRARAPDVAEKTIINATVVGLSLGLGEEYLECYKSKTIDKLLQIMQEYCISDKGKQQRLEEMNKQRSRNHDWARPH